MELFSPSWSRKNTEAILKYIGASVDVISQIKPVYNFKASNKKQKESTS